MKIEELLEGADHSAETEVTMARDEDFQIHISYDTSYAGESPPKSSIYQVWFDSEGAKILKDHNDETGYGLLDTEEAALLRNLISKVKEEQNRYRN